MSRYENGMSFWDLREAATALGDQHKCIIHFEMHLPMRQNRDAYWHVRCVARWYDERGRMTKERGEGSVWPHSDARTFVGLEYLILCRLERKIDEENAKQVKDTTDAEASF